MLIVRLAGDHLYGKIAVHPAVAGGVFDGVFLCCPFFPRDVLYEIWDLIESVSEGFSSYSSFLFPYKTEHRLYTGKVTSHLSDYRSRDGDYREEEGEGES